jgi:hypothetical protein
VTDPNQVAAKALREAADALDPGPAKGIDIEAMIAGGQAEVRALALAAEAEANGAPLPAPEDRRTDLEAAIGLRYDEDLERS